MKKAVQFLFAVLFFASCNNGGSGDWFVGDWEYQNGDFISSFTITEDNRYIDTDGMSADLLQDEDNKNVYYLVGEAYYVRKEPSTKTLWLGFTGEGEDGPYHKVEPKWYLGEWTDGKNSFTLTKGSYSNHGLRHECPAYITDEENTTGKVIIELDAPFDYEIEADAKHKTLVMKEFGANGKVISTYHKTKPKATKEKKAIKQESPSYDEDDSFDDEYYDEEESITFRRVEDVMNYLSKHTFTSSQGLTLKFNPSGISSIRNGRSQTITGAIRITLENDVAAFIEAHSPYDNSDFSFLVNCNQHRVLEITSGTDYFED